MRNPSRYQVATFIAILFHCVGLAGILFFKSDLIIRATPLNLLLMAGLLFYTQESLNTAFLLFFIGCYAVGFVVEWIGTSTGFLFGDYRYGHVLGPTLYSVPLIIGVNWFIVIFCAGASMQLMLTRLSSRLSEQTGMPAKAIQTLSVVVDGASLAVLLDWLIEPVAVKLGYWTWLGDGEIPFYNYLCWFVVSVVLLFFFRQLRFAKDNKFAVNLLLIQAMFFLLLRTFL